MNSSWIYINRFKLEKEELENIQQCIKEDWFAGNSRFNKEFEEAVCRNGNVKHFISTNSGSAAIEIAVQILVQTGKIKAGDKFLHPAITFPTSLSSALMAGMIPVYVDTEPGTYQINAEKVVQALQEHPDIRFAIIPALLGNIPDVYQLKFLLGDRPIIFDSCDLLGGKYDGREFASYGDFGAYSFYGSHHISTLGVGGGLATNSDEYDELARSMVFWGRDFSTDNLNQVQSFLKRYSYRTLGLDAQMSAIQASVGLAQIAKLPVLVAERQRVFKKLQVLFSSKLKYFTLPTRVTDKADPSWFCYPITINDNAPFTREQFAEYMLDNKVEVRPVMAGNILNHAPFSRMPHYIVGQLTETERIYKNGMFIPCYPMEEEVEERYFEVLKGYLNQW